MYGFIGYMALKCQLETWKKKKKHQLFDHDALVFFGVNIAHKGNTLF